MSLIMSMEQMIDTQQKAIEGKIKEIDRIENVLSSLKADLIIQQRDLAISKASLAYAKSEEESMRVGKGVFGG